MKKYNFLYGIPTILETILYFADNSDNNSSSDNYSLDKEEEIVKDEDEDDYIFDEDIVKHSSDDETEEKNNKGNKRPNIILLLCKVMFGPVDGWKQVRRAHITADEVAKGCFYPLAALAAISCFIGALYDTSRTLNDCMISAVKIFMALFFGNFLTLLFLRWSMPGKYKKIPDSNFGKVFVMLNLSTLALFYILYEILPMIGPALVFLPLWTIYIAMRGCRFFKFPPEKGNLLMTLIGLFILGGPIAIYWAFDILL